VPRARRARCADASAAGARHRDGRQCARFPQYRSKNGFRNDDFTAYLYRTIDYGRTWTSSSNLPNSPLNVVVQDRRNRDLLIAGNDLGVFVSIDARATDSTRKA
jgi:hypothetical protein